MNGRWKWASAVVALALAATTTAQQQFPALEKGFQPEKLYQFGGVDSVNVFSGTLLINLPIGPDYALDGGMTYGLRLSYNSKPWDFSAYESYVHAYPSVRSNAGMGWVIGMGRFIPRYAPTNLSFADLYEAPDGGDHTFSLLGGVPCAEPCSTFPKYTADGSNLRLRNPTPTVREIDFPDGVIKKFVENGAGQWDLREIRSTRSNDVLSITYGQGSTSGCSAGTDSYWAINDTRGRNHVVCFINRSVNSVDRPMVDRVVLSRQGRQLVYQFGYAAVTIPKPAEDTDQRKEAGSYVWRQTHDVQLLDTLTLPDGSTYRFTPGNGDVLGAMTLPTLGEISYQYESWYVPSTNMCDDTYYPGIGLGGFAHGVSRRTFTPAVPAGQTPVSRTWQYARELRPGSTTPDYLSSRLCDIQIIIDPDIVPPPVPMHVQLYDELVATITDPLGHKVASHFSVWPGDDTGRTPNPDISPAGFERRFHGYPYGRYDATQQRYLSQEMFDCSGACTLKRSIWVRQDPAWPSVEFSPNRLVSQGTVFHDDPVGCVAEGSAANCGISFNDSTDWDNYGHYRQISSNLRFDNRTDLRTVTTAWNKTGGTPRTIAAGDPWVLNTYESSTTTEGGVSSVEQACFDLSTGFLKGTRKLAGITPASSDLAVLYESVNGNVSAEKYYGGDVTPLASNASILCTALSAIAATTPAYRINHEWQNAQLARSQHSGMTFFSRDLTIDLDGLVTSSRDTSGLQTNYSYDANWRLSFASPPGQAQTTYTYSNAVQAPSFVPAKAVEETTFAGVVLGQHEYQYDSFGRLWRQKQRMPGNQWSLRETLYDKLERTASMSEPASLEGVSNELTFTPPHKTSILYDIFGRQTLATAPDGKSTSTSYQGSRTTARTRSVATSASSQETNATVTEHYDAQGRLAKVIESGGSTSAQAPQGAAVETKYSYDIGGRLTEVKVGTVTPPLPRTFQYDLRGFLTSENHPESGLTSYAGYDARGHARTRTTGGKTLTFTYDAAERLKKVEEGTRKLKELVFADANAGANDHQKGKLVAAIRTNDLAYAGTIDVTETYEYKNPVGKNPGGQLSRRTTLVEQVGGSGLRSTIQRFEHTIDEYDPLGLPKTMAMPACLVGSCATEQGLTTIGYVRDGGFLTSVGTFGTLAYHPSGMVKSVSHPTSASTAVDTYDIQYGMARPSSIRLSGTSSCPTPSAPTITAADTICPAATGTASVQAGAGITYQWSISGGTITSTTGNGTTITFVSNGTGAVTLTVQASNTCGSASSSKTVAVSANPSAPVITAPSSVCASSAGNTASVPAIAGITYSWAISGGSITSGTTGTSVTFTAGTSAVTLTVTATSSCGGSTPASKAIGIAAAATAELYVEGMTSPITVVRGSGTSIELRVWLTGSAPWTVEWKDTAGGTVTTSQNPLVRTVTPTSFTEYAVWSVKSGSCQGTVIGAPLYVHVAPPPPAWVTATTQPNGQVLVSWAPVPGAASYRIERALTFGGATEAVRTPTPPATSYLDTLPSTASPVTYVYYVLAVDPGSPGERSLRGAFDHATGGTTLWAQTIVQYVSLVRGGDVQELRRTVDAFRVAAGLPPSFSGTTTPTGSISAANVSALITAFNQARAGKYPPFTYVGVSPPAPGGVILREHIQQLRDALQ